MNKGQKTNRAVAFCTLVLGLAAARRAIVARGADLAALPRGKDILGSLGAGSAAETARRNKTVAAVDRCEPWRAREERRRGSVRLADRTL